MKSYYQILNVSENATIEQITKSYRKLCVSWHPDKNLDNVEKASKKFEKIIKAYEVLKNPEKRAHYDQLRKQSGEQVIQEVSPIAGYITYPESAFSEKLKKTYHSFYQKFITEPLKTRIVEVKEETSHFFSTLKKKISVSENTIDLFNKKLTPLNATYAFRKFLKGAFDLSAYLTLKDQFQKKVKQMEQLPSNERTNELFLYRGMLEILCMVYEESKQPQLLSAIQEILSYAQKSSLLIGSDYMEFFALLLQDSNFGKLVTLALEQNWNNEKEYSDDFLKKLFISQKDEQIKFDVDGSLSSYQHLVYSSTEAINQQLTKGIKPINLRQAAFLCLDYMQVLKGSSLVIVNSILQAAFLFQKAAQLEKNACTKMADEALVIQLILMTLESARTHNPLLDLYVHVNCVSIMQKLEFEQPYLSLLLKEIKEHTFKLIHFFPAVHEAESHLDLINTYKEQLKLLRDYMHQMIRYVDYNKMHPTEDEILLSQSPTNILIKAYEACLEGWYLEEFSSVEEKKLRLDAMEALLDEAGFSWFHISQNIDSDWIGVNRDKEGWLQKNLSLPFPSQATVYQSLDGLEVDFETGEIKMALKPWNTNDPGYKKSFSNFDLYEMIQKSIDSAYFSLEPINPEIQHHPFQKKVFLPTSLYKTDFLNTVFFTDYLLKFFTTKSEVQGRYPYQIRPVDSLIEHLPQHLKKIIQDFHEHATENRHRFWIETYSIPTTLEEKENKLRATFGEVRMVIKKHRMKLNEKGELVDVPETHEGWNVYVLTPDQIRDVSEQKRILESPAMIVMQNTASIFFYEDDRIAREPLLNAFSQDQLKALNELGTNKNQKICPPSLKENIEKEKKASDYEYHHFMYCLTTQITAKASKPHHFSPERVFAEEFTKHYDEFARYFPEFERLKQLNKIAAAVSQMKKIRKQNMQNKLEKEKVLADPTFWSNLEKRLMAANQLEQINHLTKIFNEIKDGEIKDSNSTRAKLQNMRNQLGNFATYHANSPEVTTCCNEMYNEVKNDLTQKGLFAQYANQIWPQVITPKIPEIINQLNTLCQQRKQNYRNQIYNLYVFLVNDGTLTASAYNDCLNQLMDSSNIEPLVQAIISSNRKKNLSLLQANFKQQILGSEAHVGAALQGNINPLAIFIADCLTKKEVALLKDKNKKDIEKCILLEENFVKMGLGNSSKEIDLSKLCHWVPASISHEENQKGNILIYGGVVLTPAIMLQNSICRMTSALLLASSIAFTPATAYSTLLNQNSLQWEIKNAENFLREVESEKQRFKSTNPFIKVDTSQIDSAIQGLNNQINYAKFQQSIPAVKPKPKMDPFEERGLNFYSLERRNVPLADILGGSTGGMAYSYFPSDSTQCVITKSQVNDILSEPDDSHEEGTSMSYILRNLTFSKRLNSMQKRILENCHPPTETDLKKMEEAEKNKSIYELTPQEAVDLAKCKGAKLKNFFLNFFEKRKNHLPPTDELTNPAFRK